MNKFKAGDEVRRVRNVEWFVSFYGKDTAIVEDVDGNDIRLEGGNWWCGEGDFELVEQWTIYNNDKPLRELTDEQVGKLVKHSGTIEHMNKNTSSWGLVMTPTWNRGEIYRAKQKSERELFIEAADYYIDCGDEPAVIAGKMFDAGFKAPKGGE